MKVTINHPYFVPYTGFFRMLEHSDIFVALDTAQFPTRGYVHRNQLPNAAGEATWLTLALRKQASHGTLIKDLEFIQDIEQYLACQRRRFPSLCSSMSENNPMLELLLRVPTKPVDYILSLLHEVIRQLGIHCQIVKASSLDLPINVVGEQRILDILQHLDASEYINAPGGKELYTDSLFEQYSIRKRFLKPYVGNHFSILHRLLSEPAELLRKEMLEQISWQE